MLAVISTHPIQYHAPVYRAVQQRFGVPVTAIYGSDCSIAGYFDPGFKAHFSWDTDLLDGYSSLFLSRTQPAAGESHRSLQSTLRLISPKAVLLTGYSPSFHQRAFFNVWRFGSPILFRGETNDRTASKNPWKASLRRLALRSLYRRCSRLLYVGRSSYEHFKSLKCPEEKLIFSPYCVADSSFKAAEADRERLREEARAELQLHESATVLLASGKLIRRKAPDTLIQAAKDLQSRGNRVAVVFLGDGEMAAELESLANTQPAVAVRFLGFKNQTQLSRYYHAADLLVLPSWAETWGLVVNEALLHGLPAVVSENVGCHPDLIRQGSTGEVCETGSVSSLSAAIQRALPLIGRLEVRQECRATVARYRVEDAARGIATAYQAVTSATGGRGLPAEQLTPRLSVVARVTGE